MGYERVKPTELPKVLIQMNRHQRRHEIKFSCRMILEDELTENYIQLLQIYENRVVYISYMLYTYPNII